MFTYTIRTTHAPPPRLRRASVVAVVASVEFFGDGGEQCFARVRGFYALFGGGGCPTHARNSVRGGGCWISIPAPEFIYSSEEEREGV